MRSCDWLASCFGQCPPRTLFHRQGLTHEGNNLFESTGLYGHSKLRKFSWPSGKLVKEVALDSKIFGEGSTVVDNDIIVLSWKARTALVFDKQSLKHRASFSYQTTTGQGWGITKSPTGLIVSDGSSFLHFWDSKTFKQTSRIQVKDTLGRPIERLNELEFVSGELLANVWFDTRIARIDPSSGRLLGWIDCSQIHHGRPFRPGDDVLNGIALLSSAAQEQADARMPLHGAELLLTGKRWDKMYRVRLKGSAASG